MKINILQIADALSAWIKDISIHADITNVPEVNKYLLCESQMFICPIDAGIVIYCHGSDLDASSFGCELYISNIETTIIFQDFAAITSFLKSVVPGKMFQEATDICSINGISIAQ